MLKYSKDTVSKDFPGAPTLPINISVKRDIFEKLYKSIFNIILSKKNIGQKEILELNSLLKFKPVVFESDRIDFNDVHNILVIRKLIAEVLKVLFVQLNGQQFNKESIELLSQYMIEMILTKRRIGSAEIKDINAFLLRFPLIENSRIKGIIDNDFNRAVELSLKRLNTEISKSDFRRAFVKKDINNI